jgi:hypothetical protein
MLHSVISYYQRSKSHDMLNKIFVNSLHNSFRYVKNQKKANEHVLLVLFFYLDNINPSEGTNRYLDAYLLFETIQIE